LLPCAFSEAVCADTNVSDNTTAAQVAPSLDLSMMYLPRIVK
jgi:hypothetical protein